MSQITDQQHLEAMSQRAAAKLQAFHDGLTEDEQVVLDRAIRRFIASEETDTQGFRMAEYEDEFGNKSRHGTIGSQQPQGGGGAAVPVVLLGVGFLLSGGLLPGSVPGEYPS